MAEKFCKISLQPSAEDDLAVLKLFTGDYDAVLRHNAVRDDRARVHSDTKKRKVIPSDADDNDIDTVAKPLLGVPSTTKRDRSHHKAGTGYAGHRAAEDVSKQQDINTLTKHLIHQCLLLDVLRTQVRKLPTRISKTGTEYWQTCSLSFVSTCLIATGRVHS